MINALRSGGPVTCTSLVPGTVLCLCTYRRTRVQYLSQQQRRRNGTKKGDYYYCTVFGIFLKFLEILTFLYLKEMTRTGERLWLQNNAAAPAWQIQALKRAAACSARKQE